MAETESIASPARADADLFDEVRLACVPGIGGLRRKRLLDAFGSPRAVFAAAPAALAAVEGIGNKVANAIASFAGSSVAADTLDLCRRRNVDIMIEGGEGYPRLLAQIDDPPGALFVRGAFEPCDGIAVAIVGARHASAYGRRVAQQLAGGLARAGCTVVSGLARGIDEAAHRGALEAGGRTIAVLGSGVLNIYPPEHADLAIEVMRHGAVVSEAAPLTAPRPGAFPSRNRIVSGLCLGTVVVEAGDRSGALITARLAGEQGREVFAVPGPIDSRMSRGCHRLIRDGAKLVESVDDILEELGPLFESVTDTAGREIHSPAELRLDEFERQVLAILDERRAEGGHAVGVDIDEIVADSGLAVSRVLAAIGVLEMRRIARRLPGNRIARL
jgi:DNA processing protein